MVRVNTKNIELPTKFNISNFKDEEIKRDWGMYSWAFVASNFQVKVVTIPPGKSQKLHKHYCKDKTCVVTSGVLEVTQYDTVSMSLQSKLVPDNYSITIPMDTVHKLSNPGCLPLEIVEIQTGETVIENDLQYYTFDKNTLKELDIPPPLPTLNLEYSDLENPECYINTENRPWGKWSSISSGSKFLIKVIEVLPKQRLSDQLHHYRSEHWVVVKGAAQIFKEKDVQGELVSSEKTLKFGESVFISTCKRHRLYNPSKEIKTLIVEVQVGDYLAEEDIVRIQDDYKRC
jgi:mannose-6-phosphate isomerase-like protein (cupin superfamily)